MTFLHCQQKDGGFVMIREGGISRARLLVMTGIDGVRLNRKEAESVEMAVRRWLDSLEERGGNDENGEG